LSKDLVEGIVIRVGRGPDASRLGGLIALQAMGAAVRPHPGPQIREMLARVDPLDLQGDMVIQAIAKTKLANFPDAL
jgi:hypothetical protein